MYKKIILGLIFVSLIMSGCSKHTDIVVTPSMKSFFQMTTAQQDGQFRNHSLEEQYQLYLYGNQVVHPPAIYLAYPFAKNGAIIIPFLKKKLETAQEEATVRDIAELLKTFADIESYDITQDSGLMALLEHRANQMQGIWKGTTLESIAEIRKQSKSLKK